jgi:hypothetical protein
MGCGPVRHPNNCLRRPAVPQSLCNAIGPTFALSVVCEVGWDAGRNVPMQPVSQRHYLGAVCWRSRGQASDDGGARSRTLVHRPGRHTAASSGNRRLTYRHEQRMYDRCRHKVASVVRPCRSGFARPTSRCHLSKRFWLFPIQPCPGRQRTEVGPEGPYVTHGAHRRCAPLSLPPC